MPCHCVKGDLLSKVWLGWWPLTGGAVEQGMVLPQVFGLARESLVVSGRISKNRCSCRRMDGGIH